MRSIILLIIAVTALTVGGVPAAAQSVSELLERGIYTEETVGDLGRAIDIYSEVIEAAEATRPYVAEALFRLGMCHLKNRDEAKARETFQRIVSEFADQEAFVTLALENMPEDPDALKLLPEPWEEGEALRIELALDSGMPIGALIVTTDRVDGGHEDLWRLRVRRKIITDRDNQSISEVLVRPDDMQPVRSTMKHSIVGHYDTVYGEGVAHVTTVGPDTTREASFTGSVYDNEEGFHLFRRLPLEPGFKKTVPFMMPWAGGVTPIEIEVTATELVEVPAGTFECHRIDVNIGQSYWVSTDSNRYLVKVRGGGIVGELAEIFEQRGGQEVAYADDARGITVSAPPDWLFYELKNQNAVALLDPTADARSALEIHGISGSGNGCHLRSFAEVELTERGVAFADDTLRGGDWEELDLAGRPAIRYVVDYKLDDRDMVFYWTGIESGDLCVEFHSSVPADRFDALREGLDAIVASYDGPRPEVEERPEPAAAASVREVITDFQDAAAAADTERYFAHLAPDAVFLGSDPDERYDVEQLRALVTPAFAAGDGWVARPSAQEVFVSDDGSVAWFDQRLDSRRYGEMRASGLLRRDEDRWRIVQYHVAFAVPNLVVGYLTEKIGALQAARGEDPTAVAPAATGSDDVPAGDVKAVLRDFHRAASEADLERYLGHVAPEGVFLGTDRTERFTFATLRAAVEPYMSQGVGWTSVPVEQRVFLAPNGRVAWFEERLRRTRVGEMRGTGVMVHTDGAWKIAHYNLVIPVPDALVEDLMGRIGALELPGQGGARK